MYKQLILLVLCSTTVFSKVYIQNTVEANIRKHEVTPALSSRVLVGNERIKIGPTLYASVPNSGIGAAIDLTLINAKSMSISVVPEALYLVDKISGGHPNVLFRAGLQIKFGSSKKRYRPMVYIGHSSYGSGTNGRGDDYLGFIPPITSGKNSHQTSIGGGMEISL